MGRRARRRAAAETSGLDNEVPVVGGDEDGGAVRAEVDKDLPDGSGVVAGAAGAGPGPTVPPPDPGVLQQ